MSDGEPVIGVIRLLKLASTSLDPRAMGQLVALLADTCYPRGPRSGALRLAERAVLEELYCDADFVEALGSSRIKSARLVRGTFARATSPSAAIARVAGLATSGAIGNLLSPSLIVALHNGMSGWRVEVQAELIGRLVEGLDTFSSAGEFLAHFLKSEGNTLETSEELSLLRLIVARGEVRDLSGAAADLLDQLPPALAGGVEDELLDRDASDDSDANEDGNLMGFVSDNIEYEDEDEDDESEGESGSGDSGGRDDDARPRVVTSAGRRRGGGGGSAAAAAAAASPDAATSGALFDALCELGVVALPSPREPRVVKRPREAETRRPQPATLRRMRYIDGAARGGGGRDSESD